MVGDDELWQGYDELGRPTDVPVTKPNARNRGDLHGASHVWVCRKAKGGKVEILLQLRAMDKPTWPGFYDISAAGHIDLGESPLEAALRETEEEIGLAISATELRLVGVCRSNQTDAVSGFRENEFQFVYLYLLSEYSSLALNDGEVDGVLWVGVDEFERLVMGSETNKKIVPHGTAYFTMLLEKIIEASPGASH